MSKLKVKWWVVEFEYKCLGGTWEADCTFCRTRQLGRLNAQRRRRNVTGYRNVRGPIPLIERSVLNHDPQRPWPDRTGGAEAMTYNTDADDTGPPRELRIVWQCDRCGREREEPLGWNEGGQ
ncbi:MAG: hypothetical protein IMZ50_15515, partial [Candidatus Atribacteria bacterium]|nr:hypothetical protein [Candidatus Atribacteria bacterium]